MKKQVILGTILFIALLAGCAAGEPEPETSPTPPETESPSPSVEPSPYYFPSPPADLFPSADVYTKDMIFDADGNLILDENGRLDQLAAQAAMRLTEELTTEEIMLVARYGDGALAEDIGDELSSRLLEDFEGTLAVIAAADPLAFAGGREHFEVTCFSIGYETASDLLGGLISETDCEVLFAGYDLTEAQQEVLDKIIEGYERANKEYGGN